MPLKVELKPGERIIIGDALVTNGDHRARFSIEGEVSILREKDIMTAAQANTPAKMIYLAVELMFLKRSAETLIKQYGELREEFLQSAPSSLPYLIEVDNEVLTGSYYKAIRAAKALVAFEEDMLNHADRSAGVSAGRPDDGLAS